MKKNIIRKKIVFRKYLGSDLPNLTKTYPKIAVNTK